MQQEKKKKRSKLKLVWQLCYIFGTLVLIWVLGFSNPEFLSMGESLKRFDGSWLLMCGLCVIGFWIAQSFVLQYCTHTMGCKISYWKNLKITMIGEYYSAITPFSTGGQPMQMGYYKRYGVGFAQSTCILAVRFVGYVSAICICFVISMIFGGRTIYHEHNAMFWLMILGFVLNFASVLFLLFILINKKLVQSVGMFVINLITKIKVLKKRKERMVEKFAKGVDEFSMVGEFIKKDVKKLFIIIGLSLLSVMSLYSMTYCIYRGMGLCEASYFDLFSMQIALYLAVAFFPTPGAIGASELGFNMFFADFYPAGLLYFAMLLWRLLTYYSNLIIGATMIIWDEVAAMIRARRGKPVPPPLETPEEGE
ncbi:MAG: flippase-like domain-containing protein [Christensenellaceae bacterium]|nr:flippase-like domain-containing protein [Christensenellaceae bacterium]